MKWEVTQDRYYYNVGPKENPKLIEIPRTDGRIGQEVEGIKEVAYLVATAPELLEAVIDCEKIIRSLRYKIQKDEASNGH